MKARRYMDSMSAVLTNLKLKNQDAEFFIHSKGQVTLSGKVYQQQDVKIMRTYRFEGESGPGDQAIIYIRPNDGSMGHSIDAYGMYSFHTNDFYRDFIKQASIENLQLLSADHLRVR